MADGDGRADSGSLGGWMAHVMRLGRARPQPAVPMPSMRHSSLAEGFARSRKAQGFANKA